MDKPSYNFRATMFAKEATYRAGTDALEWNQAGADHRLPYADIRKVRIYEAPGMPRASSNLARCVLWPRRGRAIVLSNQHFVSIGKFEDRSAAFSPFIGTLVARVAETSPATIFIKGMPRALFLGWFILLIALAVIGPLSVIAILAMLAQGQNPPAAFYGVTAVMMGFLFAIVPRFRTVWRNRPRRIDPRTGTSDLF